MSIGRAVLRSVVIPPLRGYFRYFPLNMGKLIAWKYLASHLWWLESRTKACTFFGNILDVDARDICGRFIYYFGIWEPNLTAWIQGRLKPGDCFVDVGANVGYFSLLASTLVGQSGKVISVEAIHRTFEVLRKNLEANSVRNSRTINIAAWDKEEMVTFYISPDTINGTSTAIPAFAEQWKLVQRCNVRAAPLSSLLSPNEIATTRLIKIDVEGTENRVIFGLGSILESGRRDLELVIEVSTEAFDDVVSFFRKRGFFSYHMENNYTVKSYIGDYKVQRHKRLEIAPNKVAQVDLIFSRVNADSLP